MSKYDFNVWLESQTGLDLSQIKANGLTAAADAELVAKGLRPEKPGVSNEQCAEFAQRVKNFLTFLGHSLKPNDVKDSDWKAYKPFCQALVEKKQMEKDALELF